MSPELSLPGPAIDDGQQAPSRRLLPVAAVGAFVVVGLVVQLRLPQSDLEVYRRYGLATLHSRGAIALPREYPAAAGVVFALVALVAPSATGFTVAFGLAMGAVLAALVAAGGRLFADRRWGLRTLLYLTAAAIAIALGRYDLLAALAATLAVGLASRGRWGGAWVAAVIGAALKIFPVLLLPGFFVAEWRNTGRPPWRRVAVTVAVVAAGAGLQSALSPGTLLTPLVYELRRGVEVESLAASITALVHPFGLGWHFAFGSMELIGPHQAVITTVLTVAELACLLAVWVLAWRGRLSIPAVALAVLTVAILGDRVFSAQYLIWLAPLWAIWPLRAGWVAAAALTTMVFPLSWALAFSLLPSLGVHAGPYPVLAFAAVRNAVLIWASVAWLVGELRREPVRLVPGRQPPPSPAIRGSCNISVPTTLLDEGGIS